MNKLLITGFLILSSLNCFSTCIAIYVANNGNIYVAADSRRTFLFNDDKDKSESICKIHNVGNTYFAISGFDDGGLLKAANESLQENADIGIAIKSFGTVMTKHYKKLMDEAKEFYPDKLQTFVNDGLADVSFFGFYNGSPKVINVVFTLSLDKNGKPVVAYKVRPVLDFTVIGISRDIINASPEDLPSKELMEQHPELYVEGLVKIEAKKQPLAVSEPIDLLEIKPDGAVWLRKNENAVAYE